MITILDSIFDVKGADKKSKVYGITLNGTEDITIKNCTRGGMLEIFERQPLEDVLKKNL